MACTADFALKGLLSYCLGLSFLLHVPFLDEVFGQYCIQDDRVFCIHEVLSRMDEFCHGLGLFFVKLVDEKIGINAIVECR